ncbi:MAG: FGGY-family carbohydrate kinase [Hydrogenibacillus schlegelii]|nr:FGGY-family carbohydrate kinase [Hydrogenibacillus schlegelii]
MAVMGIDLGTSGVRALIVGEDGVPLAEGRAPLSSPDRPMPGRMEQPAEVWWPQVERAVRQALQAYRADGAGQTPTGGGRAAPGAGPETQTGSEMTRAGKTGRARPELRALSVTGTSGTVVFLGRDGRPLRPAILYGDLRAVREAAEVDAAGRSLWRRLGYRMTPAFALPKVLWVKRHEPAVWKETARVVHAADYVVGLLTGEAGVTSESDALKMGFDLLERRWPSEVLTALGIDPARLPRVVPSGTVLGAIGRWAAERTGLPVGLPVVAGMTDGATSQLAAGAAEPGTWASVIGSTLVVKGVTRSLLADPDGGVYAHRHPDGWWMPGGASNAGGQALVERFGANRLERLSRLARFPSPYLVYPLAGRGERFPFLAPAAEGFVVPVADPTGRSGTSPGPTIAPAAEAAMAAKRETEEREEAALFAGYLEGMGYIERLALERLLSLGAVIEGPIRVAGGTVRNRAWLRVRASILNRPLSVPAVPKAAYGAAILAGAYVLRQSVAETVGAWVRPVEVIEPDPDRASLYEARYRRFVEALRTRGFLPDSLLSPKEA